MVTSRPGSVPSLSRQADTLQRLKRAVAWPARRLLDPRIADVNSRILHLQGRFEALREEIAAGNAGSRAGISDVAVSVSGVYVSLAELARRHDRGSSTRTGSLTPHELRCFSQNGEDGVLAEIIARIGVEHGFFVEFGIETGSQGNCVFLADVIGWDGLFIESVPEDYRALESKYSGSPAVTTLNARVTPENIEDLLLAQSVPTEPDVLSIDVDGQDYWIWEAVESYLPRIVLVEYNSSVPYRRPLTQPSGYSEPWDGTDYFGASLAAFERLAEAKNYVLVHTELAAINAFFVRADLARGRFPERDRVPRRSAPNYYLRGIHHPADPRHRGYVDLETGEVVLP